MTEEGLSCDCIITTERAYLGCTGVTVSLLVAFLLSTFQRGSDQRSRTFHRAGSALYRSRIDIRAED